MKKQAFTRYLANDQFEDLFIELGWNDYDGDRLLYPADVDGASFDFYVVAQQSGFMVLKCEVGELPTTALYKKLDTQIRKSAHEYICIYYVPGKMRQMWIVPVDKVDKRDLVSVKYIDEAHAEFLYEKTEGFTFPIGQETNILDVKKKVQQAFIVNSEKLTKKFYDEFKKQHKAFEEFIDGIQSADDRRWYASIMLDRLMFCYFIQKKGFLDNDKNYLQDKLRQVRAEEGEDEFYAFYRDFLCHLFRDGLNTPKHSVDFEKRFGRIPYLNGGMFDVHPLEQKYNDIQIKDDAFEQLFNFFDQWEWHLDTRISSSGRDINPDVLGYIFERFINDRAQMGAYYTQEDITGYIGRNTILPFLFDKVKEKMPQLFVHGGKVWKFLQQSGDRYVYDAVEKGYTKDWRERIPDYIAVGLDTSKPDLLERRKRWNEKTFEEFALPTEIWRETVERLQRCESLLQKISKGEIDNINDFITLNLDIRGFAYDILETTDDHNYVRHFYHALQHISILDPTCGSGAFLFAAMNILEPLYEVCITRMQEFQAENKNLFKEELGEISNKYRSNIQYFIFKSIILRNLYGVDIMAEAIEIAKLRLFLKMVAVVDVDLRADNLGLDPLPDIDFNIRCGNTLVGYATEKEISGHLNNEGFFVKAEFEERLNTKLQIIAKTYNTFRDAQLQQDINNVQFKHAKGELKHELSDLTSMLNQILYGGKPDLGYKPWLDRTQPFHWVAEFYEIMYNGGFDIIIGNPPYVSMAKIDYIKSTKAFKCSDLYGFVIRRVQEILSGEGRHGFIVMHNLAFSRNFTDVRKLLREKAGSQWFSFYSRIPAGLFSGDVRVRNCIYLTSHTGETRYTTRLHRWFSEQRETLFDAGVYYASFKEADVIPMLEDDRLQAIYENQRGTSLELLKDKMNGKDLYYKQVAYNFLSVSQVKPDSYDIDKNAVPQTGLDEIKFQLAYYPYILLLCCGRFYFTKWLTYGDDFHLTTSDIMDFIFPFDDLSNKDKEKLKTLCEDLVQRMPSTIQFKLNAGINVGTFNTAKLWEITDQSDRIFLKYITDDVDGVFEAILNHIAVSVITNKGSNA